MQQLPGPNPVAAPTFWQTVIGVMLANLGCLLMVVLFYVCIFAVFGAVLLSEIGNVMSEIGPGIR